MSRVRRHPAQIVLLAALLLAIVVAASGCSSSATGDSAELSIVPTSAGVVATADIRRGSSGQFAKSLHLLQRIPAFALVRNKIPPLAQAYAQATAGIPRLAGTSYSKDVEPWLGKTAGVAIWPDSSSTLGAPIGGALWIDTTNDDKAIAFARKVLHPSAHSKYHSITVYDASLAQLHDVRVAVIDHKLVFASSTKSIDASIDASRGGESLADHATNYDRVTHMNNGRAGLLTVAALEPQLGTMLRPLLASAAATGGATGKQVASLKKLLTVSFGGSIGVDSNGIWLAFNGTGKYMAKLTGSERQLSKKRLMAGLSQHVLAFIASAHAGKKSPADESAELDQASQALTKAAAGNLDGTAGLKRFVKVLQGGLAVDKALHAPNAAAARAYDGAVAISLNALDSGNLALIIRAGVNDSKAAQQVAQARTTQLVQSVNKLKLGVSLSRTTAADGTITLTLSGVNAQPLLRSLRKAAPGNQYVTRALATPFVREFLTNGYRVAVATSTDAQTIVFPASQASAVAADTTKLSDSASFLKALKAANVPNDLTELGWLDLPSLSQTVLTPIAPAVATVVDGQLDSTGGILVWASRSKVDGATVQHGEMYIPLYQ